MKAYVGTFMKKSGEVRTMTFMKVDDVPEGILPEAKGGKRPKLQEGMELVWDVENSAYRMFNHKTVVGSHKMGIKQSVFCRLLMAILSKNFGFIII